MRKLFALFLMMMFFVVGSDVFAKKGGSFPVLDLPDQAKVADVVYLGEARDPGSNKMVEGYAFIKRADEHAKPDGVGKPNSPKTSSCYEYLARGAKWKVSEPYYVNGANVYSLDETVVFNKFAAGVDVWEVAAQKDDILGTGYKTSDPLAADETSPDDKNEVYFGYLNDPGVIGVTIVWGIFGGPPGGRELVEWDQVYNQNFEWSLNGDPLKMDFANIATHELGHTVGMGDLYTSECSEQTMYGYAANGETKKQSLEPGDIEGVFNLYK